MISMIVAHDDNRVIGKGASLPWRIKADMEFFKKTTTGHTVVMGRKTWDSIPEKFRPLPDRTNMVITRNADWKAEGVQVFNSVADVTMRDEEMFVIGGQQIYEEFLPYATKLYVTRVYGKFDGDIYFPSYDRDFVERSRSAIMEEKGIQFRFMELEKI